MSQEQGGCGGVAVQTRAAVEAGFQGLVRGREAGGAGVPVLLVSVVHLDEMPFKQGGNPGNGLCVGGRAPPSSYCVFSVQVPPPSRTFVPSPKLS